MKHYTREKNAQIVVSLLKGHGIRRVIASPGTTNMALVASMQNDSFFQMYSSVDERSAAYMACGLAAETGEPVVISCTGATASRNYFPGLTEAYYRKLPILAITSTQAISRVGHHVAQVIDRSQRPRDTVKFSANLPIVKDEEDFWDCEIKVNQAILELFRSGGGPAHLNLPTQYAQIYDAEALPVCRVIQRFESLKHAPVIPKGRVAVFVGSHLHWSPSATEALEQFCQKHNAVVMCDHTSSYRGNSRVLYALLGGQQGFDHSTLAPDLLIHIGEVSGDYYGVGSRAKEIWRVNPDGEIRDTYRKLTSVFAIAEEDFFVHYASSGISQSQDYYESCCAQLAAIRSKIPELPFSNIWLASHMAHRIPQNSTIHFGILNSLRAWNFFELPKSVSAQSNVGGFGIDGGLSSLLGASLANPKKLYFGVIGDLAFFYDMNSLGNRHVGNNLRILLVNNGKGTEFRQFGHHASLFGEAADEFIAAAGHFGNQSPDLVKHYTQDLGFEYLSARTKDEFIDVLDTFVNNDQTPKSMVFEVFTESHNESTALEMLLKIEIDPKLAAKSTVKGISKKVLGQKGTSFLKSVMGRNR